jgi:putative ABC transport system ATP-binding protein
VTTIGGPTPLAARADRISKVYGRGDARIVALDEVSAEVPRGRFTAVMGPSGSGKSTLLHCMAGLDSVDSGEVRIGDVELTRLSDKRLCLLRRDRIGFVFQAFNLLASLSVLDNITLPLAIAGRRFDPVWLDTVIGALGLRDRLRHRPGELSGGQRQRVACARAMVGRPEIIFADEPTGNLDSRSSAEVLSFLRNSVREMGQTIVMVTHDPLSAAYADRALFLADGRVAGEMTEPTAEGVLERIKDFRPTLLAG